MGDMYEDGFQSIANIDISRVVIDQMIEKEKPALTFQQMNVCSLEFPDEQFEGVIAKGLMDAILCGEGSTANVAKMCMEVSRVLKPNGVFFIVSYGARQPAAVPRERGLLVDGHGAHGAQADRERDGRARHQGREQRALRLRLPKGRRRGGGLDGQSLRAR